MMRATGHLGHPLADEVGGNQGRSQAVVGGAISQLTVAIVTPGINVSIYRRQKFGLILISRIYHKRPK